MRTKKYDWNYEQIRQLYEVQGKTVEEIGVILGRSSKLVNKWCKKLGIRMRPRGQKFGPEHKGWKGGRLVDKSGYILIYLPEHPNASNAQRLCITRTTTGQITIQAILRYLPRTQLISRKR
jgi:hypothetical protein